MRCCQTNSNGSQLGQILCPLFGAKLAPLGQSGDAVQFEMLSGIETALRIEEVENRGVDRCELLQTSQSSEAQHRPLSSSKWQMGILCAIVRPAASFLPIRVANYPHRGTVRAEFVGNQCAWPTVAPH